MQIVDLTAIDKLLDFYGDTLLVKYDGKIIELSLLRDFLEDNNVSISVDNHIINSDGIFDSNYKHIVSIHNLNSFNKDDLIKI